jgi:hypothetical protein
MIYIMIYPVVGFLIGSVSGAVVWVLFQQRWIAYLAATFATCGILYFIVSFAVGMMREVDGPNPETLVGIAFLLMLVLWPFAMAGVWLVCRAIEQPRS